MSEAFSWSENPNTPFPFPYDSDLHWLWGWGQRIYDYLDDDQTPNKSVCMVFRPDRQAADAMMKLSDAYPMVIRQIHDHLDYVETEWNRFADDQFNPEAASAEHLTNGLQDLTERIRTALEVIEKPKQAVEPKWSAPETMRKWRTRFDKSERSLRKWIKEGVLHMKKYGRDDLWVVDEADPLYVEWSKNRTSLD